MSSWKRLLGFFAPLILLCLPVLSFPGISSSNPLEDVLSSPAFGDMKKSNDKDSAKSLRKYVNAATPYGRLVLETTKECEIEDWLSVPPPGFRITSTDVRRTREVIEFKQVYRHKKEYDFYVKVLVPYPMFLEAAGFNLIKQYAELQPPALPVEATENVMVGKFEGRLFQRRDGASLLIRLARNSLINFFTPNVQLSTNIVDFARMLPIDQLNEKLAQ